MTINKIAGLLDMLQPTGTYEKSRRADAVGRRNEWKLAQALVRSGTIMSPHDCAAAIWGREDPWPAAWRSYLSRIVQRLREKRSIPVETVHGQGYRIVQN